MSLKPQSAGPVPAETARVALAAFPKGSPLLTLRDELGAVFHDEDFAACFPAVGQPAYPPWRLALVTVLQFREDLSDRQAAEAARARIDWKYLLGLDLADPGFDASVLVEFRNRLLEHGAEHALLDRVLAACRERGLLKKRGRQRTDSTHVVAAIRVMNRLELAAEAVRAALNDAAAEAPDWLRDLAPEAWYRRYGRRVEDTRLPQSKEARAAYAVEVGTDGYTLLDAISAAGAPKELADLPAVVALGRIWGRHYERDAGQHPVVRLRELRGRGPEKGDSVESPYDVDARYRRRCGTTWVGYVVHLTESCDEGAPRLVVHADTTPGDVHEAKRVGPIHAALAAKGLAPSEHLVDAAYVSALLLVEARERYRIDLVGPPRGDPNWQRREGYSADAFEVDWEARRVRCPQGQTSKSWHEYEDERRGRYVRIRFRKSDCEGCRARDLCTRGASEGRQLTLHQPAQQEALQAARHRGTTPEGQRLYGLRSGIEGTVSQGVRSMGLRQARYRGLEKVRLQHVATAAALSLDRAAAWLEGRPLAPTRTSRFLALAA